MVPELEQRRIHYRESGNSCLSACLKLRNRVAGVSQLLESVVMYLELPKELCPFLLAQGKLDTEELKFAITLSK